MSERTNMELAPAPEEQLSFGDHTNIVKGKRTKRVRPQSPIPFSITANSSTGGVDEEKEEHCYNGDINNNNNNSSSTTSSVGLQDSTDEEEDMANCLILLAQGPSRESPKQKQQQAEEGMNYTKYSSRKFLEAATLGSSRAGYYVYECKTCNRTFPSFQALGGHRASHKKPKALMAMGHQDKKHHLLSSDEEEFQLKTNNKSSFSLQFNTKGNLYSHNHNNKKSKVHECSICGAEFTSGQALGGHMRRHRAPVGTITATATTTATAPATAPVPTVTATTLSFTPLALEPEEDHPRKKRHVLNLDLDLNLPAPEDDHRESKFAFVSKQQQQQHGQKQQQQQQTSLVFPAPALVNCHY